MADLLEQFRLETRASAEWSGWRGVGLVVLSVIPPAALAGPAIVAAMRLVQDTHALILDLRETRGGSPDGVALLASFLFPDGDAPQRRRAGRAGAEAPVLDGRLRPGPPLARSSGLRADELDHLLRRRGARLRPAGARARGRGRRGHPGRAHPSTVVSLTEQVELRLPVARTVNPVTGGNWESAGVQPDVPATAADALEVARQAALVKIADDPALPMPRAARPARP